MGNGKTILLVEDNPDDQALTLYALRKNHIANRVVLAQDGAEAGGLLFGRGLVWMARVLHWVNRRMAWRFRRPPPGPRSQSWHALPQWRWLVLTEEIAQHCQR